MVTQFYSDAANYNLFIFIISSFIIYKQVDYMMQKDLGFHGEQVYQLNFNKISWENNYNMKKYQLYSEKIKTSRVL